ncbi:MAG: UbiA family prenyltransferase [Planctomycetota bacterium]|nr:UbiA family prenyltransferase [Planctomycetota bacterium]
MALLQLLRFPAVFTAIADVLAGYLILRFAGAGDGEVRRLPFVVLASACLYLAGMAWNDFFDAEDDSQRRPERPIPAGQITLTVAFFIAALLSVAGLLLAMSASRPCFFAAAALLGAILFYNSGAKRLEIVGPLAMAACRGLNLFLGMCCHADAWFLLASPVVYLPIALLASYTAIVTVLAALETPEPCAPAALASPGPALDSEAETEIAPLPEAAKSATAPPPPLAHAPQGLDPMVLAWGSIGLLLVPIAGILLFAINPLSLLFFGLLGFLLIVRLAGVWHGADHAAVRRLIGAAIFGMVLLDAGMVAGVSQTALERCWDWEIALPDRPELAGIAMVAAMLLPMWSLRRRIEVA